MKIMAERKYFKNQSLPNELYSRKKDVSICTYKSSSIHVLRNIVTYIPF